MWSMKQQRRSGLKTGLKLLACLSGVVYVAPHPANSMSNLPFDLGRTVNVGRLLPQSPETMLVRVLQDIRANHLDAALTQLDRLIEMEPNYRLAHLIKGDLLLARARPLTAFGNADGVSSDAVQDLRHEALVRLSRYQAPPPVNAVPADLLELPPSQQYALLVDTNRSRLYVYRNDNGVPRYHSDYYITIGKKGYEKSREGDQRTPLGVYFVTTRLEREKLNKAVGTQAAELFGIGAWPLSYPNEWDRQHGRRGHGIWLHGTPGDTYSRPPLASNGCVVLTNQDMEKVGQILQAGVTPVVITDKVEWVDQLRWQKERTQLAQQVEAWRRDWEGKDAERFLSHYSESASANGMSFKNWAQQKRQAGSATQWKKVQLENVSVLRYPAPTPMAVVTFDQDYRSNATSTRSKKRQYWALENGQWRIVFEGSV